MSSSSDCLVSSLISRSLLISAVFLLTLESRFRKPSSSVRQAKTPIKLSVQDFKLRTAGRVRRVSKARSIEQLCGQCAQHLQAVRLSLPPGSHAGAREQPSLHARPEWLPTTINVLLAKRRSADGKVINERNSCTHCPRAHERGGMLHLHSGYSILLLSLASSPGLRASYLLSHVYAHIRLHAKVSPINSQ